MRALKLIVTDLSLPETIGEETTLFAEYSPYKEQLITSVLVQVQEASAYFFIQGEA